MIIQYDKRPDATIDQKLQSLIQSIMLAFNEAGISTETGGQVISGDQDISTLAAQVRQLAGDVTALQTTAVNQGEAIDALQTTVGTHGTDIEGLQTTVGGHATAIEGLDVRVTALEEAQE